MIFVLFAVSVITFYISRGPLPPATAVSAYLRQNVPDASKLLIARAVGVATNSCPSWNDFVNRQAGCIVPLWQQYFAWLGNVLQGNWGYSNLPGLQGVTPTWTVFIVRFPYTAQLVILAGIMTILIGFPLGVISATHNNKIPDTSFAVRCDCRLFYSSFLVRLHITNSRCSLFGL